MFVLLHQTNVKILVFPDQNSPCLMFQRLQPSLSPLQIAAMLGLLLAQSLAKFTQCPQLLVPCRNFRLSIGVPLQRAFRFFHISGPCRAAHFRAYRLGPLLGATDGVEEAMEGEGLLKCLPTAVGQFGQLLPAEFQFAERVQDLKKKKKLTAFQFIEFVLEKRLNLGNFSIIRQSVIE